MAYVPMNYTSGNWTVAEKWTVTPTTTYSSGTKAITVTNFDFAHDFSYAGERPAQSKKDPPLKCYNCTTNSTPTQNCVLSIGTSKTSDIYSGITGENGAFSKTPVYKLNRKGGTQIMLRLDTLVSAINSVSAEEGDLPASAWIVFRVPDHPAVTSAFIRRLGQHILGLLSDTDSTVLTDLIEDAISGDLNPTH